MAPKDSDLGKKNQLRETEAEREGVRKMERLGLDSLAVVCNLPQTLESALGPLKTTDAWIPPLEVLI